MFGIGRNRKALAGLYGLGPRAIIFPQHGTFMAAGLADMVELSDAEAVGHVLLSALDASRPLRDKTMSLGEHTRAFEDQMETFRCAVGVGKVRFMRDLSHILILQTPERLTLTLKEPARGRFVFDGRQSETDLSPPGAQQALVVGQAVTALLSKVARSPAT